MDADSPLKSTEGFNEEDGASLADKMVLNPHEIKEECGLNGLEHENELPHTEMQIYSNMPVCDVNEETRYKLVESNLVGSSLPVVELEEAERKTCDYGTERVGSPNEDCEKHELDTETTVKDFIETEDLDHYQKNSSDQGDNDQYDSTDREYNDKPNTNSSTPDEAENVNYGQVSVDPQPEGIEVNEEIDDENINQKSNHQSQMRGGGYSSGTATPEKGRMVWDCEKHELDADTTVKDFIETEDLDHYQKNSSDQGDNDQYDSTDREYNDKPNTNSSTPDEAENVNYGQVSVDPQPEGIEVNEEIDDENLNQKSNHQSQMRGGGYSSGMATPEKGRMVWENSSLQSPQETLNVSPSPERRLSVSAELSPCAQSPPKGGTSPRQEMSSPAKFVLKSAPSLQSPRRRHSPSPEKCSLGHKRASSRDHSSPSKRPKSPSERSSKRETRERVDSPRRRLSRSPRKNDSPRRRGSPGHQRDRRRSRSKSPIARTHSRRSPRRQSPRRRSPTYHSRQRSPRRPWSPPNRSTSVGRPGKNLFIAGFSYATTERDLDRKFSKFGRVTDVRVVRNKRTGESRGFGFVSLERDEDADEAIRAVDQTEWNGRIVLVEKSKTSTR